MKYGRLAFDMGSEARAKSPSGWRALTRYLRLTPQSGLAGDGPALTMGMRRTFASTDTRCRPH